MPFVDTNSHLTNKRYNFDIKCQSNSEHYDRHIFLGSSLGWVKKFHLQWVVFPTKESNLRLTGGKWIAGQFVVWKIALEAFIYNWFHL